MGLILYPGSFDPLTNGHIDIMRRALERFDELRVVVANNSRKQTLFSAEERVELVKESLANEARVSVVALDGLLVDYAREVGAKTLLRGLRQVADFEFEFNMAAMNRHLYPEIDTLFMMTGADNFYVSSSLVRSVAALGGDIDRLVPAPVALALRDRLTTSTIDSGPE